MVKIENEIQMAVVKVLVVEDDGIIGRHIQKSLERLGYEVVGVLLSGEEAVEKVVALNPDLVLMDISLSGKMDGVQAAELIHRQVNLPIIFLTAFADPQTLQRAKVTDPFGYLLKPFDEKISADHDRDRDLQTSDGAQAG